MVDPSHGEQRHFEGVVEAGRGLGARRMADPGILGRLGELVGFPVVPGTLNVRLPEPMERDLLASYLASDEIDPAWEAETGQAGYFWAEVVIAGRHPGVVAQADEPGYPPDLVELLSEVHLRRSLGVDDGDPVGFTLISPS